MAKTFSGELKEFVKLLVTLRRPGWGYLTFAKIGLALVGLGVSVLVPGFWETIVEIVMRGPRGSQGDMFQGERTIIAAIVGLPGFGLIGLCFWLYHGIVQNAGPSPVNNGAFNIRVMPNTRVGSLIQRTAGTQKKVVDLSQLSQSDQALTVAPGPLPASDFDDFLTKVGERTTPPLNLTWDPNDNFYRLSIQPPTP